MDGSPEPAPPLSPGVHQYSVEIDGQLRKWTMVVPPSPEERPPAGLVVVLHGVGAQGRDMRSTGFEPLAAARRLVVAYPDALGGAWNDGRPGADPVVPGKAPDDLRFLRRLIDETAARTGADSGRVAIVGFSNGAVMAARVACDLAEKVLAVALVAGSGGQGYEKSCRPARPVAVAVVAGSADTTVPYGGGRVADWGVRKRGFVAPVDSLFSFWATLDGCASTQSAGSRQVSEARGAECRSGATVLRYVVNGGGHEWFRPPTFDTTNAIWEFVSHRLLVTA